MNFSSTRLLISSQLKRLSLATLALAFTVSANANQAVNKCDFQVGWTDHVTGGLGGEIIKVTNLNVSGPGSLSEAIKRNFPRTIVFEVGGTIDLDGKVITAEHANFTIAGQTAPSPGITIVNGGLRVKTHNVVIQHLRIRPGASGKAKGWAPDGISLSSAHDIIIDHNSISWAVDENLSASGPRFKGKTPEEWRSNTSHNITFSNNIIAEALDDSTHPEGPHSKGSLIHDNVTNVLIYRNLYASNENRNPLFKGGTSGAIINNIVVNPGKTAIGYNQIAKEWQNQEVQQGMLSVVGNMVFFGKDTPKKATPLRVRGQLRAYLSDNIAYNSAGAMISNFSKSDFVRLSKAEIWPPELTAKPAQSIDASLWQTVGAHPWDRDGTDQRIVAQSKAGTTRIIDSESEVKPLMKQAPLETHSPFNSGDWNACLSRTY